MDLKLESGLATKFSFLQCNCDVGNGWYGILERLFTKIAALNLPTEFCIEQVKEKFGALRVYIGGVNGPLYDKIRALIAEAAKESVQTCEVCGEKGKRWGTSWVNTFCEDHRADRKLCGP